ncbi:MAG: response regulator [Myxococcales bacterium]|nr:response regulator [Myxococcales bacterium]
MIVVVDDEPVVLETVQAALGPAGFEVRGFASPRAALDFMTKVEPELVISDVMMPELGGLELKQHYAQAFPERRTPFVFLSSLGEADNIVTGLAAGADDYLTKPIPPAVLRAKVERLLSRMKQVRGATFRGDLTKFPFVKIMQFCELKGLTGEVAVQSGDFATRVRFSAGVVLPETAQGGEADFERLLELEEGTFRIQSESVSFTEIADAAADEPDSEPETSASTDVMGRLSTVEGGGKVFQIQTEFVRHPEQRVVSIVVLDGRTLMKRRSDPLVGMDYRAIDQIIGRQHAEVEASVSERLDKLLGKAQDAGESPAATAAQLLEDGLSRYMAKDYAGAIEVWERALALDPENKTLAFNLEIVKKKLGQ